MTRVDKKIETCSCQVCRSDLAYITPCLKEPANDTGRISSPLERECPAMVEIPPVPFVM